jgi:hypothetical protein
MKVVPFAQVPARLWDEVVEGSAEAWLFHRADWVAIEAPFFAQANCSFAVQDDRGEVAAVCPLYQRDLGRGRWIERLLDSGQSRQAGPAFRDTLAPAVRKAARKFLMRHILEEGNSRDVDRIQLSVHNLAPAAQDNRLVEIPFWVCEYDFQLGLHTGPNGDLPVPGMSTVAADQIVELEAPEEALFQGLAEDFRNAVRKGQKGGLVCEAGTGDPIADYYALAEISAQRTGERLAPRDYYQALWQTFAPYDRCAVLFALHDGRKVGALFLLLDKGSAQWLAGVSHPDYLPMRVNSFLNWQAIRWLEAHGCRRYRLGPVFPELPADWPVSRVSHFKGDFRAASRTIIQGSLFLKPQRYLEDAQQAITLTCRPRQAS